MYVMVVMMAFELENIAILIKKGVDYRCVCNMDKRDANNRLKNS